jgi:hypothetical protein
MSPSGYRQTLGEIVSVAAFRPKPVTKASLSAFKLTSSGMDLCTAAAGYPRRCRGLAANAIATVTVLHQ